MARKIALTLILTLLLSACSSQNSNQEIDNAIAEACENVKPDGAVWDLVGTEKKFAALAKLDVKYISLLDIYTKWSQEHRTIALTETGRPKNYPPFPRSLTLFCND